MHWDGVRRMPVRQDPPAPERFVATVWAFTGNAKPPITCELWEVATGLELRVTRAGEFYTTQLCRDAEDAAIHADAWAAALRAKGFIEVSSGEAR